MNGICEITIGGKKHQLRFSLPARQRMSAKAVQQGIDFTDPENYTQLLCVLFHCGLWGEAYRNGKALPSWPETMDLYEQFGHSETFDADCVTMLGTFTESVNGPAELLEPVKKKAVKN